ncbi:14332_t:CDS:2, partial [Entrophospora sp. SA101]
MFATEYITSASSQSSHQSSSTSLSNPCPALTADELALAECIEVIEAGVEDIIINKANEKEKKWRDHEIAHGEFSKQFLSAFHNVPFQDQVDNVGSTNSSFVPKFLLKSAQYPSNSEGNPWPTVIVEVANIQTFA